MSQSTYSVITLPGHRDSIESNAHSVVRDVGQTIARYAYHVVKGSTRAAVAATAAAYLAAHTFTQSPFWGRVKAIATRRAPAADPTPDTPLDPVDLASWDSFPASDPPSY